jgi:hypothetical protein
VYGYLLTGDNNLVIAVLHNMELDTSVDFPYSGPRLKWSGCLDTSEKQTATLLSDNPYANCLKFLCGHIWDNGKLVYLMANHCRVMNLHYNAGTAKYMLGGQCLLDSNDVVYSLLDYMPEITPMTLPGKGAIEHAQEVVSNAQELIDGMAALYVSPQSLLMPKVKEPSKPTVLTFPVKRDIDFNEE